MVGNQDGNPEQIVKTLIDEEGRATEFTTEGGDISLAGLRRRTEADENNDQKSLERSLSRTLYLLVKTQSTTGKDEGKKDDKSTIGKKKGKSTTGKKEEGYWSFPTTAVQAKEGLKEVPTFIPVRT